MPDVVRARELGLEHLTRPQFLAQLLNDAQRSVAVGGTSGKSTVTGMIGWILHAYAPPADRHERRGDEEFRHAVCAVRERAGRRSRAVRQRGRRERRLDRALPAGDRGADQHQPRPQGNGRAAQPVRRPSCCARARRRQPRRSGNAGARRRHPRRQMRRLRLRQPGRGLHGQESGAPARRKHASRHCEATRARTSS